MFQGIKSLRLRNWGGWPEPPATLQAVILTHGHLDHVGMLPRLFRDGFRGRIFGTPPTLAIARIILEDSAELQMEAAKQASKQAYSRHPIPEPLYNMKDVEGCLRLFEPITLDRWNSLGKSIRFRYRYIGHILGAAFVEMDLQGRRLVFSGDIGRLQDPLLFPPERPEKADILILESTYGNRLHPQIDIAKELAGEINAAIRDRGCCIIPSFAVERLQTVMYLLWQLLKTNQIPQLPIYIDSPMGTDVLRLFPDFPKWHRLPEKTFHSMGSAMELITSYSDTWKAIDDTRPKVVVAGAGMLSGGRVLAYLSQLLDRDTTRIVLVGFQAEGTRGRNLLEGAHELTIFGKYIPVQATVTQLDALSAHADQEELLWWTANLAEAPSDVYLVHGEPTAQDALRVRLRHSRNWNVHIPEIGQSVSLNP